MNIRETRDEKGKLERDIAERIRLFERKTGCIIEHVMIDHEYVIGEELPTLIRVFSEVKL